MNLFIAILTDFSHFIKIIMAMNLFGNFEERINIDSYNHSTGIRYYLL